MSFGQKKSTAHIEFETTLEAEDFLKGNDHGLADHSSDTEESARQKALTRKIVWKLDRRYEAFTGG
jgi:hypothetical protein